MFSNRQSLTITLKDSTIFTRPSDSSQPSECSILEGKATLTLVKRRKVKQLSVVLEGWGSFCGSSRSGFRSSPTLNREVLLDLEGEMLEPGQYEFDFLFIIPSNTSPYQYCNYGNVSHHVTGTVEFSSSRKSLTSSSVPVNIIQNAFSNSDLVDFSSVMTSTSEALGPFIATLTSSRLSVSSLVYLHLNFSSPRADLTITSIQLFLNQSFILRYDDENTIQTPPQCSLLANYDTKPSSTKSKKSIPLVAKLSQGVEFEYNQVSRLPNDSKIRPSTLENTDCKLDVSHSFMIVIKYRISGGQEKEEKFAVKSKRVIVGSCLVPIESVQALPAYSATATSTSSTTTSTFSPLPVKPGSKCLCTQSFGDLIENDASSRTGSVGESGGRVVVSGRKEKSPVVLCTSV